MIRTCLFGKRKAGHRSVEVTWPEVKSTRDPGTQLQDVRSPFSSLVLKCAALNYGGISDRENQGRKERDKREESTRSLLQICTVSIGFLRTKAGGHGGTLPAFLPRFDRA